VGTERRVRESLPLIKKNLPERAALGEKTASHAVPGVRCLGHFWLLSHGALCFHAAPVTDIGHVDEAIGADDGFTVERRHPPPTPWTFRVRLSTKTAHIVNGSGAIVSIW